MAFSVGTKVTIRATGASGTVVGEVAPGILRVRLDNDVEIRIEAAQLEALQPTPTSPQLADTGLWLGFVPEFGAQAWPEYYLVHLVNSTEQALDYRVTLSVEGEEEATWEGDVAAFQSARLGRLYYDELDQAAFTYRFWCHTTDGRKATRPGRTKIRPATFFNNTGTIPFIQREGHLLRLPLHFDAKTDEDIRQYTRRRARSWRKRQLLDKWYSEFHAVPDPRARAAFESEIDLHIEKLTSDHHKMSNAEILRLQLKHMEAFLEKAIRLGIERVFLIHGVGKGRLRNEIATRLIQNPHVHTFRNDYHPRYGMGATEVILKKQAGKQSPKEERPENG